jgi:hypothetical protein
VKQAARPQSRADTQQPKLTRSIASSEHPLLMDLETYFANAASIVHRWATTLFGRHSFLVLALHVWGTYRCDGPVEILQPPLSPAHEPCTPCYPGRDQGGGSEKKAQLVFARATSRKVTESQKKAQAAQLVYCESDSAWQETNRHRSRAQGTYMYMKEARNIQGAQGTYKYEACERSTTVG